MSRHSHAFSISPPQILWLFLVGNPYLSASFRYLLSKVAPGELSDTGLIILRLIAKIKCGDRAANNRRSGFIHNQFWKKECFPVDPGNTFFCKHTPTIEAHYGSRVRVRLLGNFSPAPPGRSNATLLYQIQPLKNFKKNKIVPFKTGSCLLCAN